MVLHDQSNEGDGVWNAQSKMVRKGLKESDGLRKQHEQGIKYVNQRIFNYLTSLVYLAVFTIWITASSPYLLYGSLLALVLATFFGDGYVSSEFGSSKSYAKIMFEKQSGETESNVNDRMQTDFSTRCATETTADAGRYKPRRGVICTT